MQCYFRRLNILIFSLVPVICPLRIPRSDLSYHEIMIVLLKKNVILSVIRQKCESQNRCFMKTKHAKFTEKRTFLTPWYARVRTCAYQGVRNARFSENLPYFAFLLRPICSFLIISNQSNEHQRLLGVIGRTFCILGIL